MFKADANEYNTQMGNLLTYTSETVVKATNMLNLAKQLHNCERAALYIDDENKRKWYVILSGSSGRILPFWKRIKIAFKNIFYYNKIAGFFPDKMISIGFVVPSERCTGKNMLMSYDKETGEVKSE